MSPRGQNQDTGESGVLFFEESQRTHCSEMKVKASPGCGSESKARALEDGIREATMVTLGDGCLPAYATTATGGIVLSRAFSTTS